MDKLDSSNLLKTHISNAEELELIISNFNVVFTDTVLHGEVPFDSDRVMLITGPKRRVEMSKKKLPKLLDSSDLPYIEEKYVFLEDSKLGEFLDEQLEKIKKGESVTIEQQSVVVQEPTFEVIKSEEGLEETEATTEQLPVEEKPVTEEVVQTTNYESSSETLTAGLCKYGVPTYKVEKLSPNVLGLSESLFINVEQEDLDKFFEKVKDRVITNILV